jgi:enoyl-CoA hydratase
VTDGVEPAAELCHLDVHGMVATITLDSPHNRNALSARLVGELTAHLEAATERPDVRVIVVTHTGSTFCAGADLAEAAGGGMQQGTVALLALMRLIVELPTPVVAVVRGHARAGGVGLVGACDLAVASETSTFAFTEALIGLAPAIISLTTRTRLTDREAGRKYLTGATFDGVEAARCGLVTETHGDDEVEAAVAAIVTALAKASPQGLRETKALLNRELVRRIDHDGPELVALSARLFASDEAREGMAAFRERRQPSWRREGGTA